MILFDTETTGFTAVEAARLDKQPRMVEFGAIKLDSVTLKEVSRLEFLINPGIRIPEDVVKVHHITDVMVKCRPRFPEMYGSLVDFFIGERTMVGHNLSFDTSIMRYELARIDMLLKFPWPAVHICTVEASIGLRGHRLNLGKLHEIATGHPHIDAHRAMADVEALARCVRWMRKEKML